MQSSLSSSSSSNKRNMSGNNSLSDATHADTVRLAQELQDFILSKPTAVSTTLTPTRTTTTTLQDGSSDELQDLQMFICRTLREYLPANKDLLLLAQERNWIPTLLSWLNLHDRPAVQVEALLALTNIAELCAQQTYYQHHATVQQQTSAVAAAAAQAAVSAVKNAGGTTPTTTAFQEAMDKFAPPAVAAAAAKMSNLLAPAPGSVPFPPLSFSQTLSPEAVAAIDASLVSTLQQQNERNTRELDGRSGSALNFGNGKNWSIPPAPLFPTGSPFNASAAAAAAAAAGGINFTSLAPPPGGAHSSVPGVTAGANAFLPPPTPPAGGGGPAFPQQLSASSQHMLLRHADAIPTLISLLSSPNREVYEQAMWILGSIAAGDSPGGTAAATASGSAGTSGPGANVTGAGASSALDATTGGAGASGGNRDKSVSARDVILAAGVMHQLLQCLEAHPTNLSLQRIGSWTLSNLVDGIFQQASHGKGASNNNGSGNNTNNGINNNHSIGSKGEYSSADEIDMNTLLPVLKRLLNMSDSEVLSYTCWTLSHLCDGPSSHIAAVVTTVVQDPKLHLPSPPKGGLVPRLVELLRHQSWRVIKPALRTIGNIVCAECSEDVAHAMATTTATQVLTDYTDIILECNAVPQLKELVTHSNREIQKEACWTLSNIAAGTIEQIQSVIDSGAIPPLVRLVKDPKTDQEVRSEACWVVLNATSCGSDAQIEVLVDEGCVSVLSVLLSEASMVMMALEGLERVLQVEEAREMIRREQIENGEIEDDESTRTPTLVSAALIEKAREGNSNSAVTKRADRIWKQHFVSCALCKKPFSKHRTAEASFCEECKCHVCCNCNCKIYHLDYQEELWAATEEKTVAKKNAKKSKNKKKKEKMKQKKAKQQQDVEPTESTGKETKSSSEHSKEEEGEEEKHENVKSNKTQMQQQGTKESKETGKSIERTIGDSKGNNISKKSKSIDASFEDEEDDDPQNDIDLVLYLQQTGSIIALAKLMDALEYGGEDYDEELDDYERKMIREQQLMRERAMNSAH